MENKVEKSELEVYAVKHKKLEVRMESRSGGIFTAISDYILDNNGVVFGCILDENLNVRHIMAENRAERDKMRGSKYVQSDLINIFKEAKKQVEKGKWVLFSGTPCQIGGLRSYLENMDTGKMVYMDIVCHGVPSPKVFKDYIRWVEKKEKGRCIRFDFRNKKKFGWKEHIETVKFEDKEIDSRIFTKLFYEHNILRPACFNCPYKSIHHPSDITIGDYWGIDNAAPGFNDNKGVSLVLVNTKKGKKLLNIIKDKIEIKECDIEKSMQPPLKESFLRPKTRDEFWYDYKRKSFNYITRKYAGRGYYFKIVRRVKRILNSSRE